ncbi:flagellar biosynthetic protein FliR, partial [Clostridium polynesiense]|uniref:flagellar biosynthetic protein FliR n=1 Tax=Clostridium polynesiense TaxID=1325933 RepID=UPI00058C5471
MIDVTFFILTILIFFRLIGFFIQLPVLFPTGTPNYMKIIFSLLLAFSIAPFLLNKAINIENNYMLIIYCINEIISGLVLGYVTNLCFEAIRIAGSLLDMQMGLSMLSMFDPNSKSTSTLLERLLYWTALIIFLLIDGHHILIKLIVESYEYVTVGSSMVFQETIMMSINAFIQYFIIGLKIAIPIVLIIIITDITLGLVARTVPQLNVMILGLPIKLLVGLTCFTLALPLIIKEMINAFNYLPELLRGIFKVIPVVFIFASEEKTEEATPRKKSEARKKGQVAKSKEVNMALTLLISTLLLAAVSGYFTGALKDTLLYFMNQDFKMQLDYNNLQVILLNIIWRLAVIYLPVALPIMVIGVLANYIQTGFILTSEPLKPQLSKINPINGFKRMFSTRSLVELCKNLALVSIVGFIGYKYIMKNYEQVLNIGNLYIPTMGYEIKTLILGIFSRIT